MRLWSVHPRYLDSKGLCALWREALLAQKVLKGETRGYRNHPQLLRFKQQPDPLGSIAAYLLVVWQEASSRGYNFDPSRIGPLPSGEEFSLSDDRTIAGLIDVTSGQLSYEWQHLKNKLSQRDLSRLERLENELEPDAHPLFRVRPGEVEAWEKR